MQYQTFFLGALLATTTTVFAKNPYVRSFATGGCTGPAADDKVSIPSYKCVRFDSVYDNVQVNFGTDWNEIQSLSVFSDENCQVYAGHTLTSPSSSDSPWQCVSQSQHGAKWGSVMQAAPSDSK